MKRVLAIMAAVILITLVHLPVYSAETGDPHGALIVQNSKGEYIGTIRDALMDPAGNIAFVIVTLGDKTGQGGKDIAVPSSSFSVNEEGKILLDVSKEKLSAAPRFKVSDLSDPSFAERMYRFFGLMPSWTDESPGVEL